MTNKSVELVSREMNKTSGQSADAPVYVFGMHKGGSTMLHNFIQIIAARSRINSVSISNILFKAGVADEAYTLDRNLSSVMENDFIYYGFRYVPAFMLEQKALFVQRKAIALIRDPRDCVVSAYYSFLKSHVIASDAGSDAAVKIRKERDEFANASIDDYCLSVYHRFVRELNAYAYFAHENMRIYRYEDIIFNKSVFFRDALTFLDISPTEKVFEAALQRVDVVPGQENQNAHIRNVSPGNHKIKLKQETIDVLTERSEDTLRLFGYI